MGNRLAGKVAIVTGAAKNIGRAEALAIAGESARVLVNDIDVEGAAETVEMIRAAGGTAEANNEGACTWQAGEAIVAHAIKAFGHVDILVNNAGVARAAPINEMAEKEWEHVVDVSLKCYAALIRFATPHFIAQKSGIIVNTGSSSGLGHLNMANYAAAKEGVAGLTRSVAKELGQHGVRCNMIRPVSHVTTMIMNEMMVSLAETTRLGIPVNGDRHMRFNTPPLPEHVAAMTLLLCLPVSAHVTGQEFSIQGEEIGWYRQPELTRSMFQQGGWTIEALEHPDVIHNLFGGVSSHYMKN